MTVWFSPNHETEFSDIGTVFRTVQDRVLRSVSRPVLVPGRLENACWILL